MSGLMKMEDREIGEEGKVARNKPDIEEYRKRMADERYLDHAIAKLATDLSHYLTK